MPLRVRSHIGLPSECNRAVGWCRFPLLLVAMTCVAVLAGGCFSLKKADTSGSSQTADEATGVPDDLMEAPEVPAEPAVSVAAPIGWSEDVRQYRVVSGDWIHVQVRGEADLSDDFKVSPDGTILYSFLGRVPVAGLSVSAIESNLTALLAKDYLVDPKVYVQVKSSVLRRVIVFGEVKTPGIYEMPVGERFSLLQVIAKAGGPTELAATDRVRIIRRSGGAEKAIKVNVTELLKGGSSANDVDLQPNDVITVPQSVF